ncbi:DHH family phosphoesterase [Desulfacinum hydrothermale]|nr:bifunctional oligoribonuclease/PAP phosphatase NrnA [Desulfacinum hydrothermale]
MNENRVSVLHDIQQAIRQAKRCAVATHVRPDGDAVGALLAAATLLRKLGKQVDAYCQDPPPPGHDFLAGVQSIRHTWDPDADYDAAFLVDCGELQRVGGVLAEKIIRVPVIVNIDHHVNHDPFGTVAWVDPQASSTCEMLYTLSRHLGVEPDKDMAEQLYTGILTDTGSFRFSNTTHKVLRMAAELVARGAEPAFIAGRVYDSASPGRLHLLAKVLETVEYHADCRLATAQLTQAMFRQTHTNREDAEGFINHLRSVKTVVMAVLFREDVDQVVHVSLRSKSPVDVAAFARAHGGGGHRHAAAFRMQGPLEQVRHAVTREAVRLLQRTANQEALR